MIKSLLEPKTNHYLQPYSKGFTLLEIMVAFMILSVATAGLFSSFLAAKRQVSRSRYRLAAANLARTILEDLKSQVHQETWDNDALNKLACPGASYPCTRNHSLPAVSPFNLPLNWSATYVISQPPSLNINGMQMRQVTVNIHWDEP